MNISVTNAKLELMLMNSNSFKMDKVDIITDLTNSGLPQEFITRVSALWDLTKKMGSQVIHIGKIVLLEIMKFVKSNPNLATGVAIGAAIGALTSMIPFVGQFLAPLAVLVGAVVGGVTGYRMDQYQDSKRTNNIVNLSQDLINIARKFFKLFADIFVALQHEFVKL